MFKNAPTPTRLPFDREVTLIASPKSCPYRLFLATFGAFFVLLRTVPAMDFFGAPLIAGPELSSSERCSTRRLETPNMSAVSETERNGVVMVTFDNVCASPFMLLPSRSAD